MRRRPCSLIFFLLSIFLSSCEVRCHAGSEVGGDKPKERSNKPIIQDGAAIYNGIELVSDKVKISKAYLVFDDDGSRIPEGNFVDFERPVKLLLVIDSGWVEENSRVRLSASEKVIAENKTTIFERSDLFDEYLIEGINAADAKILGLTVSFTTVEGAPTYFAIFFDVRDKMGKGFIKGSYRLYSK